MTFDDGEGMSPNRSSFTRVIVAENEAMALRVANAMLGEEVNACDYLTGIVRVAETDMHPDIHSWNSDHTWQHALAKMNFVEDDVEFVTNKFGHKVGIKLKPSR